MKKFSRKQKEAVGASALIFIILIIAWSILLNYISPSEILESIGVHNGYIIVLIGGFLGGVSLFFPFPSYLLVLTFGAAGLNPILLGVTAALGVMFGESTSYLVGHASYRVLPSNWHGKINKFNQWLMHKPPWAISLLLFIVGSIPFPNDYFLVPLGLVGYPFRKTIIPLALGNLTYNILLASIGYYGLASFFS